MACMSAIGLGILAVRTAVEAADSLDNVTWIYPKGGEIFYYLGNTNVTDQYSYSNLWI
jgi:hypothetical protein